MRGSEELSAASDAAAAALAAAGSRDEAIRAAAAVGVSVRVIASAVGLSSSRVHQIVHGR